MFRDLSIYTGAWMMHNRCVCRCKLVMDLASKVFLLMWKCICNHFNTSPGILFEIGAPCLENEAWIWFRSLRPVYKGNSGTWAPRYPNDTMKNRSSIQFKIIFCPLVIVVSSEALVGTHRCQLNLCQEGFLSPRWLMGDGWWREPRSASHSSCQWRPEVNFPHPRHIH